MVDQGQKPRSKGLGKLPPGVAAGVAAALVSGVALGRGWWPVALAAVVGYAVTADLTPRRPPRWAIAVSAGLMLSVACVFAQHRGALDWALGYLAAAVACAFLGANMRGDEPDVTDPGDTADESDATADPVR